MKRAFVLAAATLGLLLPAVPPADAASTIAPGDYMESRAGGCTLGFVASGGGYVYFMTAAHCTHHVREDIKLESGAVFGDVAARGDPNSTVNDWALIRVRSQYVSRVRPTVRGHPTAPRGLAYPSETDLGDQVAYSGEGVPFYVAQATREKRVGVLEYHATYLWESVGPLLYGDSGGPVLHRDTKQALGVVSALCLGTPCTNEGPTVLGVLRKAKAKGFPIALRLG